MNHCPLLSICIPTYNRAPLLAETLQSVIYQLDESTYSLVEIVVSDNASTDDTPELLSRLHSSYPSIRFRHFREPHTVLRAENYWKVVRAAQGTFAYIISDDDILVPGALVRILNELASHPTIDALAPSTSVFRNRPEEVEFSSFPAEDRLIQNRDEALEYVGTMLTHVSCLVFRREIVLGNDYSGTLGSDLTNSYLFVDVLARNGGCYAISQICLAIRVNDAIGYDLVEVFVTNFDRLLRHARELGFSQSATQAVLVRHAGYVQSCVYHFRSKGTYRQSFLDSWRDALRLVKVYWRWPVPLMRIVAFMAIPMPVISFIRRVRRREDGDEPNGS